MDPESHSAVAWARADLALRLSWTRARVSALSRVASLLRPGDVEDVAGRIWEEYLGRRTAAARKAPFEPVEVAEQASVLASLAERVPAAVMVRFAAVAWGAHELRVHADDHTHVSWSPWSRTLIIRRRLPFQVAESVEVYADADAEGFAS